MTYGNLHRLFFFDTITPAVVSGFVTRSPPGSFPGDGSDVISGLGGNDSLDGGGGDHPRRMHVERRPNW
jgi:hypothetical protein